MHKLTFYPLGNADCCLIDLENGQKILFDYADVRNSDDDDDLRIDLPEKLREDLEEAEKESYDVVAFTHADEDHIKGFSEFFYLEHAQKYQDEDRIKIDTLWVPAAIILETSPSTEDHRVLRQEARHRLKEGTGIRVFSKPQQLEKWLEDEDLTLEDRKDLITNAGETVPDYKKASDGVEFFVHAPFSRSIEENGEEIERNEAALVVQTTFECEDEDTKLILGADINYQSWEDIIQITKSKGRSSRLEWDIFKISHHCSYKSLSSEKGEEKTTPVSDIKWLFKQGQDKAILVSTSDPIPDEDTDQPPHRQAANYYKDVVKKIDGEFKVTMEHPKKSAPEQLVITIDSSKATIEEQSLSAAALITRQSAPRARHVRPDYFIESFKIDKLWGHRDIALTFKKDVNILIGPNGSGKTTILNLLHSILTADIPKLLDVNFEQAEIKLKKIKSRSVLTITVKVDTTSNLLALAVGKNEITLDIADIYSRRLSESYPQGSYSRSTAIRGFAGTVDIVVPEELYNELTDLVSIVSLPINRYLSITEEEEDDVMTDLEELLDDIFQYHSHLNTQLSKRYKEFEHQVLSATLYNKEHDQLDLILSSMPSKLPTKAEKEQLLGAFKDAGLLDEQMRIKINEHFAAAEAVLKRVGEREKISWDLEDILVVPLIRRTQNMMEYARKLEEDRTSIFAPLRRYEEIVNAFFKNKSIEVNESGQLKIRLSSSSPPSELDPCLLSSGEKQILILLTEALLTVNEPIVYIADEPELSLHVTWQEKLLESLVALGEQKQIIVATHSPDIVGDFRDKVIDLGRES